MGDTNAPATEDSVTEMLEDLNRQDEEDRRQIRKIRTGIRERGITKNHIMREYGPGNQRRDTSLDGCPLTKVEMRAIGDRHRIIEEIARQSPERSIRSITIAKWMRAAGIFRTNPENASKSITRHMRMNPATWRLVGIARFQLIDTDRMPEQDGRPDEEQARPV